MLRLVGAVYICLLFAHGYGFDACADRGGMPLRLSPNSSPGPSPNSDWRSVKKAWTRILLKSWRTSLTWHMLEVISGDRHHSCNLELNEDISSCDEIFPNRWEGLVCGVKRHQWRHRSYLDLTGPQGFQGRRVFYNVTGAVLHRT